MSPIVGGVGAGLVWGWLAMTVPTPRRVGQGVGILAVLGALVAEAFALAGARTAVALLAALAVGAAARAGWMSWLVRTSERGGA